jgi:hypothetical protein
MIVFLGMVPLCLFFWSFVFVPVVITETLRLFFHSASAIPFRLKFFVKYNALIFSLFFWLLGLVFVSANEDVISARLACLPLFRMNRFYEYLVIAIVVGLMYCCFIFRMWYLRKRLGD